MARDWCMEFHQSLTVGYNTKDSPTRNSNIKMPVPILRFIVILSLLLYKTTPDREGKPLPVTAFDSLFAKFQNQLARIRLLVIRTANAPTASRPPKI